MLRVRSRRWSIAALAAAIQLTACAEPSAVDGYTYDDAPVVAALGPYRYAFPANLYDDQIGPAIGGGVGLTLMWPELRAAPPGARANRSMADHYRAISVAVDHIDAVPIEDLLTRKTSTEAVTEPDSVERNDPRERLDLRVALPEQYGLTPYAIDKSRMEDYAVVYSQKYGHPPNRNPRFEDDWYVARDAEGRLASVIKCDQIVDGRQGLVIRDGVLVPDGLVPMAGCNHFIVDEIGRLSLFISYPRALLKDWKSIEGAVRDVIATHRIK